MKNGREGKEMSRWKQMTARVGSGRGRRKTDRVWVNHVKREEIKRNRSKSERKGKGDEKVSRREVNARENGACKGK